MSFTAVPNEVWNSNVYSEKYLLLPILANRWWLERKYVILRQWLAY